MKESFLHSVEQFLAEQAGRDPEQPAPTSGVELSGAGSPGGGYARAALEAECARVMNAPAGQRNHTLNRAAFSLGQLIAGGALDDADVVTELTAAAELAGLDTDPGCGPQGIAATIASGIAAATKSPRGVPVRDPTPAPNPTASTPDAVDARRHEPEERVSLVDRLRDSLVYPAGIHAVAEPEPLIDGILYKDSTAWLVGAPGNAKSFVALDIAGCVATGSTWQTYPAAQGPVLYLVAEGMSGMRQRVPAWEAAMKQPMGDVAFLPVAVQSAEAAVWGAFVNLAAELDPSLVVIDTQARVTVALEENSAKDMGTFVHNIEQLRQATGACVLTVHHAGRAGNLRGSTAIEGAATTIITTTKDDDAITLECTKQKDAPEFDPINLRLVESISSAIVMIDHVGTKQWTLKPAVSKMLKEWWDVFGTETVSASMLIDTGITTKSTFHRERKHLVDAGIITISGTERQMRFRLTRPPDS
ncbi:MAG: AAA family ATPase [Stackebrandtia sp.]